MKLKHTFRTMLLWEQITEKPFTLTSISDVVKYAFICKKTYDDNGLTIEQFADQLTEADISAFLEEIRGRGGGAKKEQKKK